MKEKTLHMIGNAHIDPVWLWQWQEGFHEVKATFRSALDRMKEFPDFVFVSSAAVYYQWVEQSDPLMFAEIQQRVREGRWRLMGGWWLQPDCNIPSGESFARQALYGQRYFKEKFGLTAEVGYNVDSFGHNGMLPQILKKAGLDYYVFLRPMPHEKGLPGGLFWWEADDGSRVLAFRIPYEYCTWGQGLEAHVQRVAADLHPPFDETMCFYGVGNHGGGPTIENLQSIQRMDGDPGFPRLVFSSPEALFDKALVEAGQLPVVHDDLQNHASGCYAAHSGVKQWNRQAENLLLAAEKLSVMAGWSTGQEYPADLEHAWQNVLFNQFHDILAGTSLAAAYEDARDAYGEAKAIASRATNAAIQAIAWNIRMPAEEGMLPLVAFNPHAWQSKARLEIETRSIKAGEVLLDEHGSQIPFQVVRSHATAKGRSRISFLADLPPLGYRAFRLVKTDPAATETVEPAKAASATSLENARFRVEFDPRTGAIASLYDKRYSLEVAAGPLALPVILEDPSDTWGHNTFFWNKVIGCFAPVSLQRIDDGPVKSTIRVISEYGKSQLIQEFSLYQDLDQIDVSVTVDWREQFKMLKLRFPININHMRPVYEIPYGHIQREANGEEEPGQAWIDLSGVSRVNGQPYGVSILNDAKYSYDVNIRDIGLTVLRSPIYAHHLPVVPDPAETYTFIDQGIQRFRYAILPHEGGWEQAGTVRRAAELNQPAVALWSTYHPAGTLPQADSFLSCDQPNIIVSVLKQAEDHEALIVRAYETHKEAVRAVICLPKLNRVIEADFGPCEIKTFRISPDRQEPVVETNLLEWVEEE